MSTDPFDKVDYSGVDKPKQAFTEAAQYVRDLYTRAMNEEREIERLESQLKDARERQRVILEDELPKAMDDLGTDEFNIPELKVKIKVRDKVFASVTADRRDLAMDWLEQNQAGDIIKREVAVAFGVKQMKDAEALRDRLRAEGLDCQCERNVHPSTLKAFVTRKVERGEDIPHDLFGVRVVRAAEFK